MGATAQWILDARKAKKQRKKTITLKGAAARAHARSVAAAPRKRKHGRQ